MLNRAQKIVFYIVFIASIVLASCKSHAPLNTVKKIDLERYSGKWYEIARFPNRFQKNCSCTTAEYSLTKKGYIKVVNRCIKDGKEDEAIGKAFIVEGSNNTKLRVQFQWPFKGNYWIIDCAKDYSHAVVSEPRKKYLWILSRKPNMEISKYDSILSMLKSKQFDVQKLIKNEKDCN